MKIRSEHALLDAVKVLMAGVSSGRQAFSRTEAKIVLEDAVAELMLLRAAVNEWACRNCKMIFPRSKTVSVGLQTCPNCQRILIPHLVLREEAFCARIDELTERTAFLESVVQEALTLEEDSTD